MDAVYVQIFGSSQFLQFFLPNYANYLFIAVSLTLAPYAIFIFISGLPIFGLVKANNYTIGRTFGIILLALLLAITIQVATIFTTIIDQLDLLIEETASFGDYNESGNPNALIYLLMEFLLTTYQTVPDALTLFVFISLVSNFGMELSIYDLIINSPWYVFGYFIIFFSIFFIIFNKKCDCEEIASKKRSKEKKENKNTLCSKRDLGVLVVLSMILMLPLINVVQIYNLQSPNYVDWSVYYSPSSHLIEGDKTAGTYIISTNQNFSIYEEDISIPNLKVKNDDLNIMEVRY